MIVGKLYCLLRQDGESILARPAVNSSAKENQHGWNARYNNQFVLIYLQKELICSTVNTRCPSKERSDWRCHSVIRDHTSTALQSQGDGNTSGGCCSHTAQLCIATAHKLLCKNENFLAEPTTTKRKIGATAAEYHRNTTAFQLLHTETGISIITTYWKKKQVVGKYLHLDCVSATSSSTSFISPPFFLKSCWLSLKSPPPPLPHSHVPPHLHGLLCFCLFVWSDITDQIFRGCSASWLPM